MATTTRHDLEEERSPRWRDVQLQMHRAIMSEDETGVQKCLNDAPTLKLWLHPEDDVSAVYRAIQVKAFRIYGLLVARDCVVTENEMSSCYCDLSYIETAEIQRQQRYTTAHKDAYIDYVKSKSLSLTPRRDFKEILDKMVTTLAANDLLRPILKVVATAPYLKIVFDFDSESVQRTTGSSRTVLGLNVPQNETVFVGGKRKEEDMYGTFVHELCHMALYLIYRNNGRPYFSDDKMKETKYKTIVDDIRTRKEKVDHVIQGAFWQNEEQELVVRVPHILAQYGTSCGYSVLEEQVPDLLRFFQDDIISDMHAYLENGQPLIDSVKIQLENARLQHVFRTRELNVTFESPLDRGILESKLLHVLVGPDLGLLEVMTHDAVRSTRQTYLFLRESQWDSHLEDVLIDYKCAFIVLTVNRTEGVKDILIFLRDVSHVTGTKVILLVADDVRERVMTEVRQVTHFAQGYEVRSDLKASLKHVTESCKREVFNKACIGVQGFHVSLLQRALTFDTFCRSVDSTTFLSLCETPYISVGTSLRDLDEGVRNYYVEQVCTRAVEINLKECNLDDQTEAFAILGPSFNDIGKLLPSGYQAKEREELAIFEKFVLLKDRGQYQSLKESEYCRKKTVHLLQLNKTRDGFMWTQSNGRLSHLPMTGHTDFTLEKLTQVNDIFSVVSGAPGMGKSVLATRMCAEVKRQEKRRWVFYVNLPQSMARVKTASPSLKYVARLCEVNEQGIEFGLFEESLENGAPFQVVIILDSFDEINEKCRKHVVELLSYLSKTKIYKVYVFTRTAFKSQLEDALRTVSYELAPFSDEKQTEFLVKYRRHCSGKTETNDEVSQQFRQLYYTLRATNQTILQNPLLLRMMAEMENGEITESHDYSSLLGTADIAGGRRLYRVHIYRMFVEYKHLVYRKEKRNEDIRRSEVQDDENGMKLEFYVDHGLLAMLSIFPEDILEVTLSEDEMEQIKPGGRIMNKVVRNRLKEGFVNGLNGDGMPIFVHETFAEFFAASYLLQMVTESGSSHFADTLLRLYSTIKYEGVMLLFDGLASASFPLHSAVINNNVSHCENIDREDIKALDKLGRTPLHVAALHANETIMKRLPMDDKLIMPDIFGISPFRYAEIFCAWDSYSYSFCNGHWQMSKSASNSIARHRLNMLCAGCSCEALNYSHDAISARQTFEGKRRFIIEVILTSVKHDLEGVLDVYLSCFSPSTKAEALDMHKTRRERTLNSSLEFPEIGSLDKIKDNSDRTVMFLAKSSAVYRMLVPYCDVGAVDKYGNTMLHTSAEQGSFELFSSARSHLPSSSVDVRNKHGETPLHTSARGGSAEITNLLLPLSASVNAENLSEGTPMDIAVKRGNIESVKLLLLRSRLDDICDSKLSTTLHIASEKGHAHIVTFLLPHTSSHAIDHKHATCLHAAIGKLGVVTLLIPHSLVNFADYKYCSPVHVAAEQAKRKDLQALWPYFQYADSKYALAVKAQPMEIVTESDYLKKAAAWCMKLHILHSTATAAHGHLQTRPRQSHNEARTHTEEGTGDVVRIGQRERISGDVCDAHNRDTYIIDKDGNTMLHTSAVIGDVGALKCYLPHSFVSVANKRGDTPLHLGAQEGHRDVVEFLVPLLGSVNVPNVSTLTPMHICSTVGRLEVVKLLLLRSKMCSVNKEKETSLHVASRCRARNVLAFLLPHSKADARDISGRTCLHVSAFFNASRDVFVLLIPHSVVNRRDAHGNASVIHFVERDMSDELKLFIPYCCDWDIMNLCASFSALRWGRKSQVIICVKLCVLYSDVNATDQIGRTALHKFAVEGKIAELYVLKLLLPHSCVHAKDPSGRTPLDLAKEKGRDPDITQHLQRRADMIDSGSDGRPSMQRQIAITGTSHSGSATTDGGYSTSFPPVSSSLPSDFLNLIRQMTDLYQTTLSFAPAS